MGRSQVLRNRTHGRPGQGRGGRGGQGDRGRGGGGRGGRGSRHKGGADPRTLGDNAFRFERSKGSDDAAGGDSYYDGLLDDINFLPSGGVGEYYGDSHYAAEREEEDLADAGDGEVEDWMSIDVKSLDKFLRQIPIHERLKLPQHIGRHLEEQYGVNGGGKGRKKTIAELREESKATVAESKSQEQKSETEDDVKRNKDGSEQQKQPNNAKEEGDASGGGADEEEEDLDAWLDDMIA